MNKWKIVLIICVLLIIPSCSNNKKGKNIGPTFLWNTDQADISVASGDRNIWSGFSMKDNFFLSNKSISKFIFFRKSESKETLKIRYELKGEASDIFINGKKKFVLFPAPGKKIFKKKAKLLKGFNFLEFRRAGKGSLKIETVTIGKKTETERSLLLKGEEIVHYYPAGNGEIELSGKGKVVINKVEFIEGDKKTEKNELGSSSIFSDSDTYNFKFKTHGFLKIKIIDGKFKITDYGFNKKKSEKNNKIATRIKGSPNVFIFLIDGCHTDHLGIYGYKRDTSPVIDKFADDAVVFENAYANATFTRSSVASLFTGYYPHRHKLRLLTNRLPKGLYMMPEFFRDLGYKTSLLTEAGNISRVFGFAQGVDNYFKAFFKWDDHRYLENNIIKAFNKQISEKGPIFSYLHFRAPHFPIIPPPPFLDMYGKRERKPGEMRMIFRLVKLEKQKYKFNKDEINDVINDYDSSIRHVDSQIGELILSLKKQDLYDKSFIIFTSDHGEAVYEHGVWGHGHNVYNETTRVPLIIKFPKYMGLKGKRIERVTQLVDIFPTFAELFGKERFFDGESIFKSMEKGSIDDRFAFSTSYGAPPSLGIRWRNWSYIIEMYNNSEELFDLEKDILKDVSGEHDDILTFFRARFLYWLNDYDNLERTSQSMDLKKLPKEEYENLKSLGYIN
ncbi:MAG: sulfatase [Acidobacteriota bacterium]